MGLMQASFLFGIVLLMKRSLYPVSTVLTDLAFEPEASLRAWGAALLWALAYVGVSFAVAIAIALASLWLFDRLLATVTAFCQEIPYQIIPDEQNGLTIDGLIVSTKVAVDNWGDCDSKSVLFAALWTSLSAGRTLLILVPGYKFVVVPGLPRYTTETGLDYEGLLYLCLEPVGPAKQRPCSTAADSAGHIAAGNYQVIPVD